MLVAAGLSLSAERLVVPVPVHSRAKLHAARAMNEGNVVSCAAGQPCKFTQAVSESAIIPALNIIYIFLDAHMTRLWALRFFRISARLALASLVTR